MLHLVQQRILPQAENHHETAIPGSKGSEEVLFGLSIRIKKEAEQCSRLRRVEKNEGRGDFFSHDLTFYFADLPKVTCQGPTFSLSVLIWMAFGMSLAVFSFVIEVTSFSRIVICIRGGRAEF